METNLVCFIKGMNLEIHDRKHCYGFYIKRGLYTIKGNLTTCAQAI